MRKTFFLFLIICVSKTCFSQSWETLSDKIIDYYYQGNYDKALATADKAMKKAEKDFGKKHQNYGESLMNKAFVLQILDEDKTAESLYLEGLKIIGKAIGENNLDYAYSLEFVGSFYLYNLRYYDAKPYFESCIEIKKRELGENNDDYAYTLSDLASIYEAIGQYPESETLYLKVKKIYRDVLGEENENFIKTLKDIAFLYDQMGRYAEAEGNYEYALKLSEKVFGKNSDNYALILNNLANLYFNMGNYGQCKGLYLDALEIRKAVLGKQDPLYAQSLGNYALLNEKLFNLRESETLYAEAKEIMLLNYGSYHPVLASLNNNMASLYQTKGEFRKAKDMYLESIEITRSYYGEENRDYALYSANLADLYTMVENYPEAEALLLKALEIEKKILGEDHPDYAMDLHDLAVIYQKTGRYGEALQLFLKSLEIIKKTLGTHCEAYSTSLSGLASFYFSQGLNKKSLEMYDQSLKILETIVGKDNLGYTTKLMNMGYIFHHEKEYGKAEECYKEAIETRQRILPENHYSYGFALFKLAELYDDMIQVDKAIGLYLQAMDIIKNSLGTDNVDYANLLNRLAQLYELTDDKRQVAEHYYLEAQNIMEEKYGKNHEFYISVSMNLGLFYAEEGKIDKAKKIITENNKKTYQLIEDNFLSLSESDKEIFYKTVKNDFDAFNTFYLRNCAEHPELSNYLYENELRNKGLLLSSNQRLRNSILQSGDKEIIETYNQWLEIRQKIAFDKSLPLNDRDTSVTYDLDERANNLERDLQLSVDLSAFSKEKLDWQAVRNHLGTNSAAIEFFNFSYNLYGTTDSIIYGAAIAKKGIKTPIIVSLFDQQQLERLLSKKTTREKLVTNLYVSKRGAATLNAEMDMSKGDSLYQLVWEPLDEYLEGIQEVYISPSGLLHQISFAALPYPNENYLSDKYGLYNVSNTRQIALEKPGKALLDNQKSIVVYGGIEYNVDTATMKKMALDYNLGNETQIAQRGFEPADSSTRAGWQYLFGTKLEAQNITKLFGEKQIQPNQFIGNSATEESFKYLSGENAPNVIHVATHGFFFPDLANKPNNNIKKRGSNNVFKHADNPLFRSGLLFAGANYAWRGRGRIEGVEDGILTAYEVASLNLQNTDLVVMSACETGLGEIKGSEGVYGLQRSFKLAGAEYLIMSLWQVPDKETMEFMQLFYGEWLKEKSVRDAFNDAQAVMRRKYDPYYWAAFVLVN